MKNNKLFKKLFPAISSIAIAMPFAASITSCTFNKSEDKPATPTLPFKTLKNSKSLNEIDILSDDEPLTFKNEDTTKSSLFAFTRSDDKYYQDLEVYLRKITTIGADDWEKLSPGVNQIIHPGETFQICAKHTNSENDGHFSLKGDPIKIHLSQSDNIKLGGSIQSLLCTSTSDPSKKIWNAITTLSEPYCFADLFNSQGDITWISPSFLPYSELTEGCYENMFAGCTNLRSAPVLPAITLAKNCYKQMFSGCQCLSLIDLPARKLADGCYEGIIQDCKWIKTITLGYVGNFSEKYFKNWVNGTWPEEEYQTKSATIYYSGEDTEVSDNALPTKFSIAKTPYIENITKVITFTEDELKTGELLSTAKKKVRAYNDQTFEDLDVTNTIIPQYKNTQGEISAWFSKDTEGKYTEISDITKKTIAQLPNTLAPKFGFAKQDDLADVTQLQVKETAYIRYSSKQSGSKVQIAEYVKGKAMNFVDLDATKTTSGYKTKTLEAGKSYVLRGNIQNTSTADVTSVEIIKSGGNGSVKLDGTALSLVRTDIEGQDPTTINDFAFVKMFKGSTAITAISPNYLCDKDGNAIGLTKMCYASMFEGCTGLGTATSEATFVPELKATTSAGGCYYRMFAGCTKIAKAPAVMFNSNDTMQPHGTYGVCASMFEGCSSLTNAGFDLLPETIGAGAYDHMFKNCIKLENPNTTAPMVPTIYAHVLQDGLNNGMGPLGYMFEGCSKLKYPAKFGYTGDKAWSAGKYAMKGMYYQCSNLYRAPNLLKFTSISNETYGDMFKDCENLNVKYGQGEGAKASAFLYLTSGLSTTTAQMMFGNTASIGTSTSSKSHATPKNNYYYYIQG